MAEMYSETQVSRQNQNSDKKNHPEISSIEGGLKALQLVTRGSNDTLALPQSHRQKLTELVRDGSLKIFNPKGSKITGYAFESDTKSFIMGVDKVRGVTCKISYRESSYQTCLKESKIAMFKEDYDEVKASASFEVTLRIRESAKKALRQYGARCPPLAKHVTIYDNLDNFCKKYKGIQVLSYFESLVDLIKLARNGSTRQRKETPSGAKMTYKLMNIDKLPSASESIESGEPDQNIINSQQTNEDLLSDFTDPEPPSSNEGEDETDEEEEEEF